MYLLEGRVSGSHAWTPPQQWSARISIPMLCVSGSYPALRLHVLDAGARVDRGDRGRPVFDSVGDSDPWGFSGPILGR
jgi:hypothetical protein